MQFTLICIIHASMRTMALVRVPIASLTPAPDAPSPVSFARNTVLGSLLSMAGRFEVTPVIIQQGFYNWDISQRDPTIRSEQNLFGGRFVGKSLSGL